MSVTSKAIWYIEGHLNSELSLAAIADAAGVSPYHLCRAFTSSTGISPSGYARSRRLSEAAKTLGNGAPDVLSVALDAGYGSREAFTRAFRQHFGLTPEQLRAQAQLQNIILQEPIQMNPNLSSALPILVQRRLVTSEALLIFGLSQRCHHAGDPAIPSQWNAFLPHLGHIEGQIGNVAYGVIHNSEESGNYDYTCGVAVRAFPSHPPQFTRLRIPPQAYAVFDHSGHVSTIASTWKAIWERDLADSGFDALDGPAFERYDEKFDGRTGLGGLEIWVPLK